MNKMLVAVFDTDTAALAGLQALRRLHAAGDITLYATGVIVRDEKGVVGVHKSLDEGGTATVTGLAVGSLIGLLGGPMGLALGAMTGTLAGAMRDFWIAGVGFDFVEEAQQHLLPGKSALVAEIEEEWITPVDAALEAAGGTVFRRSRDGLNEARFNHDVVAFRAEVEELESEASHAGGAAKARLQAKLDAATARLDAVVDQARQRASALRQEADDKAGSLQRQLAEVRGDVKARIDDRVQRVKAAYHARGAKLSQAWSLTREALAA